MVGLILAAPLTSAVVHIAEDLARMRGAPSPTGAADEPLPAGAGGPATSPA